MTNRNSILFVKARHKVPAESPNKPGPSPWEGVPRVGFTAYQAARLGHLDTPEGRKVNSMILDAPGMRARRRSW